MSPLRSSLILACLAVPLVAAAQPAGRGDGPAASTSLEAGFARGGELSDNQNRRFNDIDVSHVAVAGSQTFAAGPHSSWSLEAEYQRYDLDVDRRFVPLPEKAQSFTLQASYRQRLDERWTVLASVKPGFHNADDAFNSEGFGVQVGAVGLYRSSDSFTWAFGVIYRSLAENDRRVLPALGFDWRPSGPWSVSVGFPRSAVTYTVSSQVRVSFGVSARGGTYYVKEPVGAALSSLPPVRDTVLDYAEIRLGFGLTYRPVPELELSATAGAIVYQNFDYYDRGYQLDAEDTTPYVGFGAKYSF